MNTRDSNGLIRRCSAKLPNGEICGWIAFDSVTILVDHNTVASDQEESSTPLLVYSCRQCGNIQPDGIPPAVFAQLETQGDAIHIRIANSQIGRNAEIGFGFSLGTTPSGYGVKWSRGPEGLGKTNYWFSYDFDAGAVKLEFENQSYVFALADADESKIRSANPVKFESEKHVR